MTDSARDRAIEDIAARVWRESHVSSRSGQCEALEEIARDLRALLAEAGDGAGAATPADRVALIPGIEWALFGTEDGDLVGDDSDLPVGELRRLLRERWVDAAVDPVGDPTKRESIEDRAMFAAELRAAQAYHAGLRDGFVRGSAEVRDD